jgi:hypothetical protein
VALFVTHGQEDDGWTDSDEEWDEDDWSDEVSGLISCV